MNSRIEFQKLLETITPNVYFQPPSNISIKYPAIVYNRKKISKLSASNSTYKVNNSYDVTVIDRNPDSSIADKVLNLNYCEFDRQFVSNGLNHTSFTIYY